MLPVYGNRMPLKLLNEIIAGKTRELEHTVAIRELIPRLEAPYARVLRDWENVFTRTRDIAQEAQRTVLSSPESMQAYQWAQQIPRLVDESLGQSREFTRQLRFMQLGSSVIRSLPGARQAITEPRDHDEDDDDDQGPQPADGMSRPTYPWSGQGEAEGGAVPIGGHRLPPLPYPYNALEPWIDEKTMRIHHDKHHKSYVDGLNAAEKKLEEARRTGDFDLVKHWERELAFNGAGHYLHTIFWDAMSPSGGGKPSGELLREIERSFGSFDAFKKQFSEAANKVEGGGWAILVWSPRSHRLELLTAEKHQNLSQWDVVPLLPLDVWEHAYYLKHQNERAAYIKDWWNVVNWPLVADRYAKAKTLRWVPW